MSETLEVCGSVLNRLVAPCRLPKGHDGLHESVGAGTRGNVRIRWPYPGAPSAERLYDFVPSAGDSPLTPGSLPVGEVAGVEA